VNILDGYPALAAMHAGPPPEPECRPIRNYLTGYAVVGPPPVAYGGSLTITSGDPTVNPPVPGTIRVTVTQAQSTFPREGSTYLAVREVVQQVAANANLAGSVAALAAIGPSYYAAEVALSYGVRDTAKGVISTFGFPLAMRTAVETAAGGVYNAMPAVVAQTVTTAALAAGVPPAIAAAAGAAAGTRRGLGKSGSAQNSVREALVAAGRPAAIAAHEALLVANAVTAASPVTGQFTVTIHRFHTNQEEGYVHT
jgi:hypothetical protein